MNISKEIVGNVSGIDIVEYIIENDNGITIGILNFGATITKIITPDRYGNFENIVMGFDDKSKYLKNFLHFGNVIGRVSGRVCKGMLTIDGIAYNLDLNLKDTHIHGGENGFHSRVWDTEEIKEKDKIGVMLRYISLDGEEGFPGTVETKVLYTLNNENELEFDVEATTDKTTVVNITNHSYFNLSGSFKENILNHYLKINADRVLPIYKNGDVSGKINSVENTVFDFRKGKTIGADIDKKSEQLRFADGYDHPLLFNDIIGKIELWENNSGRHMEITTNNEAVIFYSGNCFMKKTPFSKKDKNRRIALCLETQNLPIGENEAFKENSILRKNEVYKRTTKYKFSVI